ncbi:MAG TPA: RNA polymerase sigma factor [Gemmatimonadaceae bacterium]|nr:RNA polymerase sigma factor [Gemmatimonadaceae bacterium]
MHDPVTKPPAELISRVKSGDTEALGEIYARYSRPLMQTAYRLTGNAADAEDVLHDVFLGLPEALRHYDERGAAESWLKRLTARVALSRIRSRTQRRESPLAEEIANHPRATASLNDDWLVQNAIDELPESLRVVFVLKEIEGYSHSEIAATIGISVANSEVRLHRAVKALRKRLAPKIQ